MCEHHCELLDGRARKIIQGRELILRHERMTEDRIERQEGMDWNTLAQVKKQWRML
jgi:hypothetical protein